MAIAALCTVAAALTVLPNRSQFFQYESVSLSCGQQGKSPEWRVMRNTSKSTNQHCFKNFSSGDVRNESQCLIDDLYPSDSGVYWCESAAGRCSDTIWITVTAGPVVLESPSLPVTQGDDVSLTCRTRTTSSSSSSSSLTAHFYKDGLLIGSSSTGHTTIRRVSKADEGLYKCSTSGGAESPDSRLTVRGRPEMLDFPHAHILLPVVVVFLSLVSASLLYFWRRQKGQRVYTRRVSELFETQSADVHSLSPPTRLNCQTLCTRVLLTNICGWMVFIRLLNVNRVAFQLFIFTLLKLKLNVQYYIKLHVNIPLRQLKT
uniref:uncharacterized protein LOC124054314 isoform X2 n=1 Tax=Scatophagus argus TaxID=75038 RepID=UPI001ED809B7|nr:uncharacterized protein LOC124054314 isoform X2 [Scatophagus argus]